MSIHAGNSRPRTRNEVASAKARSPSRILLPLRRMIAFAVWSAAAFGKFDADGAVVGMELVCYGRLFVELGNELEEASRATRRRRTFARQNHGRA